MNESGAPKSGLLIITEAEAGIKLLRYLERKLDLPRPSLFRLLRTGQVRINKGRAKPDRLLLAGDEVRLPPQYAGMVSLPAGGNTAEASGAAPGSSSVRAGSDSAKMNSSAAGSVAGDEGSGSGSDLSANDFSGEGSLGNDFEGNAATAHDSADGRQPKFYCPGLKILRAERHYLVIDKPAGLPVQPGSGHCDCVSERLKACAASGFTPAPAHRLDRQSSGLLLAGRTYAGQRYLHGLFSAYDGGGDDFSTTSATSVEYAKSALNRRYLAWVSGLCEFSGFADALPADFAPGSVMLADTIFQACGPDGNERMYVRKARLGGSGISGESGGLGESADKSLDLRNFGKPARAVSVFRVLKRLAGSPAGAASLLEVTLLTGRKHQIRVQCASRGFPLIGDKRYGGPSFSEMLLHAYALSVPAGSFMDVQFAAAHYFSLPAWTGCFAVTDDDFGGNL